MKERALPSPSLMLPLAAVLLVAVLMVMGKAAPAWVFDWPKAWTLPAARWIGGFAKWLTEEAAIGPFSFSGFTRLIAALVDVPYQFVLSLISTGFLSGEGSNATLILPRVSWIAVIAVFALLGYHAGGARLALLQAVCLGFVAVFGQWDSAMVDCCSAYWPIASAGWNARCSPSST